MKRKVNINEVLTPLEEKPIQAYMSNVLQVADVLEWIVDQTGKADVCRSFCAEFSSCAKRIKSAR
jgi:hypothetical protein